MIRNLKIWKNYYQVYRDDHMNLFTFKTQKKKKQNKKYPKEPPKICKPKAKPKSDKISFI